MNTTPTKAKPNPTDSTIYMFQFDTYKENILQHGESSIDEEFPREGERCELEPSRRESGIFLVSECVEETQITATAVITVEDIRSGCRTGTCI